RGESGTRPNARKIRNRCGAARLADDRPGRRRRLRHGRHCGHHRHCYEKKEIPLHVHWSPPVHEPRLSRSGCRTLHSLCRLIASDQLVRGRKLRPTRQIAADERWSHSMASFWCMVGVWQSCCEKPEAEPYAPNYRASVFLIGPERAAPIPRCFRVGLWYQECSSLTPKMPRETT